MIEAIVRRFLYYPSRLPADEPLPYFVPGKPEQVTFPSRQGTLVHGLYWPAEQGRPTILFLHGNAQSVFEWSLIREDLAALDCGLLLIDYPGYGKSEGAPSEETNYGAGYGALDYLTNTLGVPDESIIVFGKSLGGGVTCEIAQNRPFKGVVLESTFTSIPNVARVLLPMLPADAVFRSERYDSIDKLAKITCPTLVVHGTRDEIIPFDHGEKLFAAANEPKEFYVVDGGGHNDVSMVAGPEYGRRLRAWLDGLDAGGA
ncbi:alpha/beta hydrolase [bacterium]|nr:alpha/beta hydrolase [bacterium]MCB9477258.1 alpha/beta hydrolase [Deltaproteobacteria bacterium]